MIQNKQQLNPVPAALYLFHKLQEQGAGLIDQMVKEGQQESLFLDFKAARSDTAPMQEDDRKTLAEAISGFANSDGGIIVWGIDCRSVSDGPDEAQALKPISNLARWLSDLNQYSHQVASPEVIGVEHFIINETSGTDRGYAVTYVPRIDGPPIMAIAKKKEQYSYFIRSGSSFVKMESFMVADRFGRRPHPKLELAWRVLWDGNSDGFTISIVVGIKNIGRGVAMYPALNVGLTNFFVSMSGLNAGRYGLPMLPTADDQEFKTFLGGIDYVIHPGVIVDVAKLTGKTNHPEPNSIPEEALIKYRIYCDGFDLESEVNLPLRQAFMDKFGKDL